MKTLVLALLFTTLACTPQHATTDTSTTTTPSNVVVVTGVITDEGVECLAMRGDDGKLYTLGRPANPPAAGTRVRVTGTVAEVSTCMQGITLSVTKLEKI